MIKKYNEFIKEGQLSFGFENAYQGDPLFKPLKRKKILFFFQN